jgi:CHRD domain
MAFIWTIAVTAPNETRGRIVAAKQENKMLRLSRRPAIAAAMISAFLMTAPALHAATVTYGADLKGSTEVPPNDSKGTGSVTATFDQASKKFTYTATYSGLTGPATAAHFHGPAAAGANAPPVIPIPAADLASPIKGEATLTDAQAADLAAGKWYFNVHTAANKGGEIRGQLTAK